VRPSTSLAMCCARIAPTPRRARARALPPSHKRPQNPPAWLRLITGGSARNVLWALHQSAGHHGAARVQALKDAGCSEVVLAINYQPKVRAARMRLHELPACARRKRRCCPESPAAARVAASGPMRGPLRRALQFWRLGLAQVMMDFLKEWEEKLAIKITCSQARRPAQPRDHPPASLRGAAAPRLSPPRHAQQRGWLSGRGGRAAARPCSRNLGRSCASVCDGVPVVTCSSRLELGTSVWPLRQAERSEGCEGARAAGAYPLQDSWAGAAGRHGRAGDRRSRVVLHSC